MKKTIAMLVSIMLLLTMVAALPVLADGTTNTNEPVNIPFVNPSFELDETGTTTRDGGTAITGWTTDDPLAGWEVIETDNKEMFPSDGTKLLVAKSGKNEEGGSQYGRPIKQTLEIPADADYYRNMADYKWTLSLTTYYICVLDITAYNNDKSVSATTQYSSFDGRKWETYDWQWDITEAVNKVGKARYIEFSFRSNTDGQPTVLENLKLTCQKKEAEAVDSIIKNGDFETTNDDGSLAAWDIFYPEEYGVFEYVNDVHTAAIGNGSVKLSSASVDGNTYGGYISQMISVEAGEYYKIKFTYKSALDGSALVEVTDKDDWSKPFSRVFRSSGAGYATVVCVFKAPQTKEVEFALRCYPGAKETIIYENVSVSKHEVDESELLQHGNLLVNASFELDATDSMDMIGWSGGGDSTKVINDARARDGEKVMYKGYDVISQRVEITEYDKANNNANYGYKLEFSYGSYDGGGQPVEFILEFEDETFNTTKHYDPIRVDKETGMIKTQTGVDGEGQPVYEYTEPDLTTGFPHVVTDAVPADICIDISALTKPVASPLKAITVSLPVVGTNCWLDDFKLYEVDKNQVTICDEEGNVVEDIVTDVAATYVADVDYFGDEADARVYLALYEKADDEGTLLLKNIDVAKIVDGAVDLKFENISATAGTTIVKAYLWYPLMNAFAETTVE